MRLAAVRTSRSTDRLDECAKFYSDVIGLPLIDSFDDHSGYWGRIFGLPDRRSQLELVRAPGLVSTPDPENCLVLYFSSPAEFAAVNARIESAALTYAELDNPYWHTVAALGVEDPAGWLVILVPPMTNDIAITEFDGDRGDLEESFLLAEDSHEQLARYRDDGRVWVAHTSSGLLAGHIQVIPHSPELWEIQSVAVSEELHGNGIGRRLIEHVIHVAAAESATVIEVATATADISNLRFYQRCGFRMTSIASDYFTTERGYTDDADVDGIPLNDQVRFRRTVKPIER